MHKWSDKDICHDFLNTPTREVVSFQGHRLERTAPRAAQSSGCNQYLELSDKNTSGEEASHQTDSLALEKLLHSLVFRILFWINDQNSLDANCMRTRRRHFAGECIHRTNTFHIVPLSRVHLCEGGNDNFEMPSFQYVVGLRTIALLSSYGNLGTPCHR